MNLFSAWKSENTNNRLGYGIHENVVIKLVDVEPRKKQDGSVMKVSMFITYTQVDPTGKPLAEIEEFVFWPKHDSRIGALPAVLNYMNRMSELLACYYPLDAVSAALDGSFETAGYTDQAVLEKALATVKGMKDFVNIVNTIFVGAVTPMIGLTSAQKFRLKVTFQEDGRGVEVPTNNFIEAMTIPLEQTRLVMTNRDIRAKMESEKPKAATDLRNPATPGAPGAPIPGIPVMPAGVPGIPAGIPGGVAPVVIPGTAPVVAATGPTATLVMPTTNPIAAVTAPGAAGTVAAAPGTFAMPFLAQPVQ